MFGGKQQHQHNNRSRLPGKSLASFNLCIVSHLAWPRRRPHVTTLRGTTLCKSRIFCYNFNSRATVNMSSEKQAPTPREGGFRGEIQDEDSANRQ